MENTLQRKRGPAPSGIKTSQYTLMLEAETAEWGKQQPGGLSGLVRRLLREAHHKTTPPVATPDEEAADERLWQQEFQRDRDVIAALAEEALQEHQNGRTVPLETVLADNPA